MKLKFKSYLLPILLGFISSNLTYIQVLKKIEEFSYNTDTAIFKEMILNRLFVVTDFDKYEFMEGNQIYHYLGPFFMYFLAVYLSESSYLDKSKEYLQFIASRATTQDKFIMTITKNIYLRPLIFLLSYNGMIFLLLCINDYPLEHNYTHLILKICSHIVLQYFIVIGISFFFSFIYLKLNGVLALIFSLLLLNVLIMIDVTISSANLLFYDDSFLKIEGIIFGGILFILTSFIFRITRIEID